MRHACLCPSSGPSFCFATPHWPALLTLLIAFGASLAQGKQLATGQLGTNSDVIVWDVANKREQFRYVNETPSLA